LASPRHFCLCLKNAFITSLKGSIFAFSALTLLVGQQEGHPGPVKN